MKRFLILLMVLGLIAGSVATAEAKGRKRPTRVERTVEGRYGPYPAPVTGCNEALGSFACLVVEARPTEAFFTAKVTDAHGQPVFVEVRNDYGLIAIFCGETTEPIAINQGSSRWWREDARRTLEFYVGLNNWPGDTGLDCPVHRVKTTGTISVTLSGSMRETPRRG